MVDGEIWQEGEHLFILPPFVPYVFRDEMIQIARALGIYYETRGGGYFTAHVKQQSARDLLLTAWQECKRRSRINSSNAINSSASSSSQNSAPSPPPLPPPKIPIFCYNCGQQQRWFTTAEQVTDYSPPPYEGRPLATAGNTYLHETPVRCERCNVQLMTCPENAVCAFCDAYQKDFWWLNDKNGFIPCQERESVAVNNHSADSYRNHEKRVYVRPAPQNCRCHRNNFHFHSGIAGKAIVLEKKNEKYPKGIYGGFVMVH